MSDRKKHISFKKFFIVIMCIQAVLAFSRDFIASQRYPNFQQWSSNLVPATLGLIVAATFNSAIAYGIYKLYKAVVKKGKPEKSFPAQ